MHAAHDSKNLIDKTAECDKYLHSGNYIQHSSYYSLCVSSLGT